MDDRGRRRDGGGASQSVDWDRRPLSARPAPVPGVDSGRVQARADLRSVRAESDATRLPPAGDRDFRWPHRARGGAVAIAAAVEAGRGPGGVLRRARFLPPDADRPHRAAGRARVGDLLRLRRDVSRRRRIAAVPVLGLSVHAARHGGDGGSAAGLRPRARARAGYLGGADARPAHAPADRVASY